MLEQESQSAAAVLMVRPACFGFNPETAASNAFQRSQDGDIARAVLDEFDGLQATLHRAGVRVVVAMDTPDPIKPDAVFPNNWVSFHADGTVVLYPMLAANRRLERREDVLGLLRDNGFAVRRIVNLSAHEAAGRYLEGTGSLVLDRSARVAYAGLSARTDPTVLEDFAAQLGYEVLAFAASDANGLPIYHTNVFLSVGTHFAVFCGSAVDSAASRAAVRDKLEASGHEVVEISRAQMQSFSANVLELSAAGGKVLALSAGAHAALEPRQRRILEKHVALLCADVPTIERIGGGGVRCMLAEIHLPGMS